MLRGAVHPVTGVYYFASGTVNGAINLYAWNENVTPQNYVQVGTLRPTAGSSAFGANGDMAFSASGQLVLVADNFIYSSDLPATLEPSTATIDAKQVHDMGAGVQGNGIAFGNLGHIFVSVGGPTRTSSRSICPADRPSTPPRSGPSRPPTWRAARSRTR